MNAPSQNSGPAPFGHDAGDLNGRREWRDAPRESAGVVAKALAILEAVASERATVLALPFHDPTCPAGYTTIMHAMRLGTPVIATECVGISEHIVDGRTGLITPHGDPVALRTALRFLWRDARPRQAMAAAARRRASRSLDADDVRPQLSEHEAADGSPLVAEVQHPVRTQHAYDLREARPTRYTSVASIGARAWESS